MLEASTLALHASGWFWAFLAALVLLPGAFLAFLSVRDERDQARALAARAPTQPINVHEGGHITVNNNYAGPPHGESDQSPGVGSPLTASEDVESGPEVDG